MPSSKCLRLGKTRIQFPVTMSDSSPPLLTPPSGHPTPLLASTGTPTAWSRTHDMISVHAGDLHVLEIADIWEGRQGKENFKELKS